MDRSRIDEDGRVLAYIGSVLFSVGVAIFAAVAFIFRGIVASAVNSRAINWPTASGQVTTTTVKALHARGFDYAVGTLGYSYSVDDNYYSGYFNRQFWDEQRAWSFVDGWKDRSVLVHFKVGNAAISALREFAEMGGALIQPANDNPTQRGWGPILSLMWSFRDVSYWAQNWINSKAKDWPSTDATVEYAEPKMTGDDENLRWCADLHYSFKVNGCNYSDSYYFPACSVEDAEDVAQSWRNRKVLIHYLADTPARSVFIPEEQNVSLFNAASSPSK